jgi:hypothetical protein
MKGLETSETYFELRLPSGLPLSDSAEVALEDYAREVTGSRTAEAVRSAEPEARVVAIRLRGFERQPEAEAGQDVVAFARELALARESGGLGWS